MNDQPCVTSDFLLRSKCSVVPPRLAQGPCGGFSSLPFSHNCKLGGLVIDISVGVPGFSAWCVYMCECMCAHTHVCVKLEGYLTVFLYFGIGLITFTWSLPTQPG